MADYPREIEVSRVMNLVRGFGWEKEKEEVQGRFVVLTIKKEVMSAEQVEGPGPPS